MALQLTISESTMRALRSRGGSGMPMRVNLKTRSGEGIWADLILPGIQAVGRGASQAASAAAPIVGPIASELVRVLAEEGSRAAIRGTKRKLGNTKPRRKKPRAGKGLQLARPN